MVMNLAVLPFWGQFRTTLWGLVWFVSAIGCFSSIVALFGRHFWVFELFSHFRVQYFSLLLVASIIFFMSSKHAVAAFTAILALVNLFHIIPLHSEVLAEPTLSSGKSQPLRVVLLNVNYHRDDYEKVVDFIQWASPDLMVLVETNQTWMSNLERLQAEYPYVSNFSRKKYGIALFSRLPFKSARILDFGNFGRPSVVAELNIDGQPLTVIGTHPFKPSNKIYAERRNQQFSTIANFLTSQNGPTMLLGDLNTTPWSPYFQDLLQATGLHDTREGYGLQTTWPTTFPPLWIPIDHCLVSSEIVVNTRQVGPDVGSDHYPIIVDFSLISLYPRHS